jgi:hypothetical protein
MATSERKRKILEHLAKSIDKSSLLIPQSPPLSQPEPEIVVKPPEPERPILITPKLSPAERKRRVLSHVQESSGNFGNFELKTPLSKQQKMEHIRKSLG